jgi:hypothetical protein
MTAASFAAGAIDAAAIATGAIDADAIATNAIDADAIATGAIDAGAIAANAFTGQITRSVQCGSILIPSGAASSTATITSVNTARAFIVTTGWAASLGATLLDSQVPRVVLLSATTVQANRGGTPANGTDAAYCVVEFM